jgi:GR25 family glycosyltransferase involved in LPS biosynthesis
VIARYFDRIYCINLDDRPDRWRYISSHLARFALRKKIKRFSAIDIRKDAMFWEHEKLQAGNFSLLANCGCILSHRRIIEMARQSGLRNVLVFEDDVKILESNIGNIGRSLSALEKLDWDIFYLGATYLFSLQPVGDFLVNVSKGAYATHAIAYNRSIFDKVLDLIPSDPSELLESDRFKVNAVDKWLQSELFDHSRFFGTNPIMVVQGLQESNIAFNQQPGIEQKQIELFRKSLNPK